MLVQKGRISIKAPYQDFIKQVCDFWQTCGHIEERGEAHKYRAQDLWLASQAIQNGFKLLTKNKKDFSDIPIRAETLPVKTPSVAIRICRF